MVSGRRVGQRPDCQVRTRLMSKQNKFDSKAGTTARAIETLMGQYFD